MNLKNIILLFIIVLFSTCSKITDQVMTVEKNCTGTYLNKDNKNFLVCNRDILDGFSSGQILELDYKIIDVCEASSEWFVCKMLFPYEELIRINKIH